MTDTLPNRRSIRLPMYDYTSCGGYFITICTQNQQCVFGNIVDGQMVLNDAGQIVADEWEITSQIRDNIQLDQWVVMPNHFHGILFISNSGNVSAGTARRAPTKEQFAQPVSGSIPTIVRSFKSAVTKRINELQNTAGCKLWQRNYYEHIVRDENDLNRIREYIKNNPAQWKLDQLHPER